MFEFANIDFHKKIEISECYETGNDSGRIYGVFWIAAIEDILKIKLLSNINVSVCVIVFMLLVEVGFDASEVLKYV
jgi:hypothetical protein